MLRLLYTEAEPGSRWLNPWCQMAVIRVFLGNRARLETTDWCVDPCARGRWRDKMKEKEKEKMQRKWKKEFVG